MTNVILTTEEYRQHLHGLSVFVRNEPEHSAIAPDEPQPIENVRPQRSLMRCFCQAENRSLDRLQAALCTPERDVRMLTKLLVALKEVVKDQFKIPLDRECELNGPHGQSVASLQP